MVENGPWFRRVGLSFWPATVQGWAATAVLVLVELPLLQLLPRVPDGSPLWWLLSVSGVAVFAGFMALVLWKTKAR